MIRLSPQLRAGIQRSTLPALIVLSGAILVAGKTDQTMFETLRTGLSDVAAPVLDVASRPLGAAEAAMDRVRGFIGVYQVNRRLEEENQRLLQWQQVALKLTTENRQLQGLLKVVPDRAISYVTARVIANSGGAYVRTVMINAGSQAGLARGQAVITGDGLVGRLTEVGDRAARARRPAKNSKRLRNRHAEDDGAPGVHRTRTASREQQRGAACPDPDHDHRRAGGDHAIADPGLCRTDAGSRADGGLPLDP